MVRMTSRPSPVPRARLSRRPRVARRRPVRRPNNSNTQRVAAATNVGAVYKMPINRISTLPNGVIAIHNKEIVITLSATATAGVLPATPESAILDLSGDAFAWLGKFGSIYDKFSFKSLKLTFVPTLPTTTSGSIAVWFDSDEADVGATAFVAGATNEAALVCPIFEQSSAAVPNHLLSNLPWYSSSSNTTGPTNQGWVNAVSTSAVLLNAAATGVTLIGYVMAEYVVHLKGATSV